MPTLTVAHRTASGSLRRSWEYDHDTHRVHASVGMGLVDESFDVEVCSQVSPALGACPIVRVDGERWKILPARYVRVWPGGVEALVPLAQPIAAALGHGVAVVLTNTPERVSMLLEAL